jgi:peptidyl-prolyl cis-trans isomerase D
MVRPHCGQDLPMLAIFRRFIATWPARLFFGLLVISFGLWGVADVIRNIGRGDGAVASVAGETIQLPELQDAYRRNLSQTMKMLGNTDPSADVRRAIAAQTVSQLVSQKALAAAARQLGIAVPDAALAAAVQDVPQFHNAQGAYDPELARQVLRNNGLNERSFGELFRADLAERQVMTAIGAGAAAPDVLARQEFAYQQEKRVADVVEVPFATANALTPAPTPEQLERWWANHPEKYSKPEYRRIKAIVLAPATLASEITVTDDDLKGAWEQQKATLNKPERRSVEVILTQDQAEAERLAGIWGAGADWTAMQQEASKSNAAAIDLPDAARAEFPAPELADAVFATPIDTIPPPVHSALGWHVLKVTKITPGAGKTFEESREALRQRVIAEKAADIVYDRANRIENLFSGGSTLDTLPGDLGVAAVTGTLDAEGKTPEGQPAPIPGAAELRAALLQTAFAAKPGDPPKLLQAPNGADGVQSFYAVVVEQILPPAPRPLAEVTAQATTDWTADQRRHQQEEVATKIYSSLKGGFTLAAAAAKSGLAVRRLPPTGRGSPAQGFPAALLAPLFGLKQGEATMVETPDSFVVAELAQIVEPDPKADPIGFDRVRQTLAREIGQDIGGVYANAVRDRGNPHIDEAAVAGLAAAPGE